MKSDIPHEHLPPVQNHAAVNLSHEAFAPPSNVATQAAVAARPVDMVAARPTAAVGEMHNTAAHQNIGAPIAAKIDAPPCPPGKAGGPIARAPEAPVVHGPATPVARPPEVSTAPHQSGGHSAEKAPCPPGQKAEAPEAPKAPHQHQSHDHKSEKAPCPPGQKAEAPEAPKAPHQHQSHDHKPEKAPCPTEHKPVLPGPPHTPTGHHHDKTPCPPAKPREVTTPVAPPVKPPTVTTPPEVTTPVAPPVKLPTVTTPPEVTTPVAPPKVVTPPVETPPAAAPPVVAPPVVIVPVIPQQPVTPPIVAARFAPIRYSPPAEMIKPLQGSDFFAPPAVTITSPGKLESTTNNKIELGSTNEVGPAPTEKITEGGTTKTVATSVKGAEHAVGTPHSKKALHKTEVTTAEVSSETATVVAQGEVSQSVAKSGTETAAKSGTETAAKSGTETAAKSGTETVAASSDVSQAASPAAELGTVPHQEATKHSWAEATTSYSPHYKTTVGTATVGTFFNDQNYGYVQGTYDVTHHQAGDVSAMYGHSLLSAYGADGQARRGNINVEGGVVIKNGPALEGSKIPVLGKNGVRLGVNGYYELDKDGKTTLYGGAEYASSPKQADAQVGVSHRFNDVTLSGGYEVSKVDGYKTSQFATTSVSLKLNDSTEIYTGAAVSNHKEENRVYAGVRFRF